MSGTQRLRAKISSSFDLFPNVFPCPTKCDDTSGLMVSKWTISQVIYAKLTKFGFPDIYLFFFSTENRSQRHFAGPNFPVYTTHGRSVKYIDGILPTAPDPVHRTDTQSPRRAGSAGGHASPELNPPSP